MTELQQSQAPAGDLLLQSLLPRFSRSVAGVAERLAGQDVTARDIADALFATHPDYGGVPLSPQPDPPPPRRPVPDWLALVHGVFDPDAVAASPARVINGRLTILALARLDDGLAVDLRTTAVRQRLLRDLRFSIERVLLPWALSPPAVEVLELWTLQNGPPLLSAVFSPDGRLLATAGGDATVRLWIS